MGKKSIKKKNAILVKFAKGIRNRRHELNLSQEQLAELAEVHVNYVGGIERSERNPSLTIIVALAKALKMPISQIFPE